MIADAHPPATHIGSRRCIRHDGIPKRAFLTRDGARWYARKVLGIPCRQYQCDACLYWHNATKQGPT